jgi:uridine kinase
VADLNEASLSGEVKEVIKISEGFHEKKIASVADAIARRGSRLVLISGPSAAGKTTFIKRLSVQLRVAGIRPVALSLDDYYLARAATPLGPDGKPDFECIEALDLPLLNEHLSGLLAGRTVDTPRFDFPRGVRADKTVPMRLDPDQILLMEGIHGLNERLTPSVPLEAKFRVFVSALTQLCIDEHNRIFTSDSRLLRRMVRDRIYRGYTAAQTIAMWPSVRRGEETNIFPFQEEADDTFNSALVYEPGVLKLFAERYLMEVRRSEAAYGEAFRLLKFLAMFVAIFPEDVPQNSILREYIGGSSFHY